MPKTKEDLFSQYKRLMNNRKRSGGDTPSNSKRGILGVCIYHLIVLSILLTIYFRYTLEE